MAPGKSKAGKAAPKQPSQPAVPQPAVVVRDDGVHVVDTALATRLYQKGFVGTPQPGNTLRLSLVEAAWLDTQGRCEIPGGAAGLLRQGAAQGDRTEIGFLAYSDLRARGLVVRHFPGDADANGGTGQDPPGWLQVWPRGEGPPRPPAYPVRVASEGDGADGQSLLAAAAGKAVLAVVDGDGAVTHYQVERENPHGVHPPAALPKARGLPLADRVLVSDTEAAAAYGAQEFLGTPSPAGLVLSRVEAASLARRGLLQYAKTSEPVAPQLLAAYEALRNAGVVVKSGFRFGTHLRGYATDPDAGHALWLIHCLAPRETMPWSAVSRAIRLAHGVRKRFLIAVPQTRGPPAFVALSWFKP